jgi:hypothetical protein
MWAARREQPNWLRDRYRAPDPEINIGRQAVSMNPYTLFLRLRYVSA